MNEVIKQLGQTILLWSTILLYFHSFSLHFRVKKSCRYIYDDNKWIKNEETKNTFPPIFWKTNRLEENFNVKRMCVFRFCKRGKLNCFSTFAILFVSFFSLSYCFVFVFELSNFHKKTLWLCFPYKHKVAPHENEIEKVKWQFDQKWNLQHPISRKPNEKYSLILLEKGSGLLVLMGLQIILGLSYYMSLIKWKFLFQFLILFFALENIPPNSKL